LRRLIDAHTHLSELDDMEGVVFRARQAGVDAVIAVGTNLRTCIETLRWAELFTGYIYPCLGVHPTEWMGDDLQATFQFMEERIDVCAAVGEIGLDYWKSDARKSEVVRQKQREIFTSQLHMAADHDKPVSIHGRGSWHDALKLALEHGPGRGVFHWFSGPLDVLDDLLDAGYFISATPAAEFSKDHRSALSRAPLERILIETDSPVSYHDKTSEPSDLPRTLRALSSLKEIPEGDVARTTTRSTEELFKI